MFMRSRDQPSIQNMKHKLTLLFTAVLLAPLATLHAADSAKPDVADARKTPTVYMVSTAHLDTQWLWTIQDTIVKMLPETFNGQFKLLEQFPDYQFNFEGAFRYKMIKEYYPAAYERMKQYIAAGRWHVAGSAVDAGDVNIPSPESLIRQVLYGNGFFKDEFGKRSSDIFLPDCFGFGHALPTVAAHCNLDFFSTSKLGGGTVLSRQPFKIGNWEGVDGSSVVAVLKTSHYTSKITGDVTKANDVLLQLKENKDSYGVPVSYRYFGVGDGGGAPPSETVEWLKKSMANTDGIRVVCDSSTKMREEMTPEEMARLPHYKGELLMSTHGTGCYTSHAEMKRFNRQNEQLGDASERAAVIGDWFGGMVYPKQMLKDSWFRFLWHQFHDDLTGTSYPEAYVFSQNDEVLSLKQFSAALTEGVGTVSRAMDTRTEGTPVIVYNPLAFEREDVVRIHLETNGKVSEAVRVFEKGGREVLSQTITRDDGERDVLFLASVPSVGFKAFDVRPSDKPTALKSELTIDPKKMENEFYRLSLDDRGDIAAIYDKKARRELLSAPARIEMLAQETQTHYTSWESNYQDVVREPKDYFGSPCKIEMVESGPLRVTLAVTRHAAGSSLKQLIHLTAGPCGTRIEVENELDWKTIHTLLKARFPMAVQNRMATYDLGMGTIQRPTNSKQMYEVPAQQWADLTAEDGHYGVAILNDCKYGWDKPNDSTLRLTLLNNQRNQNSLIPMSQHLFFQEYQDFGRNRFTFAFYGHGGDWQSANVAAQAARLNQPLRAFAVPKHEGRMGSQFSMLQTSDPRMVVTAFKQAEKSGNFVLRLVNQSPVEIKEAKVRLAAPIEKAQEVFGDEERRGEATIKDGALVLDMKPYQPRSFSFSLAPAPLRLDRPKSVPVAIKWDNNAVSADGQGGVDGMDQLRRLSFPRELFPRQIDYQGVKFEMGPASGPNALVPRGQKILLPAHKGMKRLYVLAASSRGDQTAVMRMGGNEQPSENGDKRVDLTIVQEKKQRDDPAPAKDVNWQLGWQEERRLYPDWTEPVGQADTCIINGRRSVNAGRLAPGYVKPDPVAWICTHLHNDKGENVPYTFGYLFVQTYDVPEGVESITLPWNDHLRIMAMSFGSAENDEVQSLQKLTDTASRQ
jgi:alpha-mannosidase